MKSRQKILIVDDKPENLYTLDKVLSTTDAEIIQASSGNEALVASLNHDFALAIVDVQMPDMDGYELAELLRSEKKTRHLPIIFLSAVYSDDYHIFRGYEAGGVDFVTKPYNPEILLGKVKVYLQLDRQGHERLRAEGALRKALDGLEARVRERTAELEDVNKALQVEISERKAAEELLRKANRALRTLGECNEALVHEAKESALLRRVCRIITEVGGYRMAWVGIAGEDGNKTVSPVAYAGYEAGYLDTLQITWADSERGRGPTGTAVRTGKPHVSRNILTNPAFDPWRSEALYRGYASSIALPLNANDRTFGALTIYAPEPDAFDEEEVDFLIRLAENLSYGIISLHTKCERKRADEELKVYMAKLEQSNRALQDFASIASHDLQEPLRKVMSFGDRLKHGYGNTLGEEGLDFLSRMMDATSRMQLLLKSLLDYSRISTRAEPFVKVDLNRVVHGVLSDLEVRIEQEGGRVEVEDLPHLEADPNQMRQLFQNLIGNALKFHGNEKPVIKVHARDAGQKEGAPPGSESFQILVEDNGIGFDEKYLQRIFAPFQRLHGRGAYEGAGMGLAICHKIIERHGGSITATSIPGKGSAFIVTLPAKHRGDRRNVDTSCGMCNVE